MLHSQCAGWHTNRLSAKIGGIRKLRWPYTLDRVSLRPYTAQRLFKRNDGFTRTADLGQCDPSCKPDDSPLYLS